MGRGAPFATPKRGRAAKPQIGGGRTANYLTAGNTATDDAKGFRVPKNAGAKIRVSPSPGTPGSQVGRSQKGGKQQQFAAGGGGTRAVANGGVRGGAVANAKSGSTTQHAGKGAAAAGGVSAHHVKAQGGKCRASATEPQRDDSSARLSAGSPAPRGNKLRARGAEGTTTRSAPPARRHPSDDAVRAAALLSRAPRGGVVLRSDSKPKRASCSDPMHGDPAERYIRILHAIPPVGMPPPLGVDGAPCVLLTDDTEHNGCSPAFGGWEAAAAPAEAACVATSDAAEARSQLLSA